MDAQALNLWLEDKRSRNYGATKEHTAVFHTLLTSAIWPLQAATELNDQISASEFKDNGWRCRQLLLAAIAELPEHHHVLLQFTVAILENGFPALRGEFWWDWGDEQRYLWSRREYHPQPGRDKSASRDMSEVDRNVNFVIFSAKLARATVQAKAVLAASFFDLREALENSLESQRRKRSGNAHFSAQELKWINVEIATQWVIHGQEGVLDLKNEDLGEGWERGLAVETDLWKGASGFSAERWELWRSELVKMSEDKAGNVPGGARLAAAAAARIIGTRFCQE